MRGVEVATGKRKIVPRSVIRAGEFKNGELWQRGRRVLLFTDLEVRTEPAPPIAAVKDGKADLPAAKVGRTVTVRGKVPAVESWLREHPEFLATGPKRLLPIAQDALKAAIGRFEMSTLERALKKVRAK